MVKKEKQTNLFSQEKVQQHFLRKQAGRKPLRVRRELGRCRRGSSREGARQ